jgi:DNA polymerase III subunit delta'
MNKFLDEIVGQPKVKKILSQFIESSKIPHALLFIGNEGVGKENAAVKFTQAINTDPDNSDSQVTQKIGQLSEPFIKYIVPLPRGKNETEGSGATEKLSNQEIELLHEELQTKIENLFYRINLPKANNIKISSIREIKKFLTLDFTDLKYRVILISQAHLMNEESQNALLKNLEEPPENVIFILTTAYPSRLRETIRSRCWKITFDPLLEENIIKILTEKFNQPKELAASVVPFSYGSVLTALELTELDFYRLKEKTISVLRYALAKRYNSAIEELNSLLSDQKLENIELIVKMILTWLNDLYKYRSGVKVFFYKNYEETLQKFNARFPDVNLTDAVKNIDRLASIVRNNVNQNLLSTNLIYEISAITS